MTSDVSLSNSQRRNLLTLQGVDELSARTQGRLASGKKVNTVLDGAVTFFRAKVLSDTATDFNTLKEGIDQGVSAINAYLNGIQAIEDLLSQIKGLVDSTRSQTQIERQAATRQFKELGKQIHNIIEDAKYNGVDLLARTSSALKVKFGTRSTSTLVVGGLNLNATAFNTANPLILQDQVDHAIFSNAVFDSTGNILLSKFAIANVPAAAALIASNAIFAGGFDLIGQNNSNYAKIDQILASIDKAIDRVRSHAAYFGNNVGILNVRLKYTKAYVNELTTGSEKLTLADLNEEGANLVALQTRQQLGLQSLKISTDNQKAILNLLG